MDTRCLIGLPQWQHTDWYADRPNGLSALQRYAQHFSSVEGNSSFYGMPAPLTLQRWLTHTPQTFEFCFKVPRQVTHDAPLREGRKALAEFLSALAPASSRVGLLWFQLSDKLGPENLTDIEQLLAQLPTEFEFGLEVRHPAFFAKGEHERRLNALLMARGVNRVMFDTRLLFRDPATDAATLEAKRKKPSVPLHVIATGNRPMIRFMSPMDSEQAKLALSQWATKISQWVAEDKRPIIFFHTPDNSESPALASRFAQQLQRQLPDFEAAPPWPAVASQANLF